MNPWIAALLGFAAGQLTVFAVFWFGHKLSDYRGKHEADANA